MAGPSRSGHPRAWKIRCRIDSIIGFLATVLILGGGYMSIESRRRWSVLYGGGDGGANGSSSPAQCNLFSGKWVYDEKSYPLYKENHCSFMPMFNGVSCERIGRMDSKYQHWRWQPHDCDLPRFDAMAMMERLRGKRLVFVGDSITRNQWASMVCMLESSISPALKSVTPNGSITSFKMDEYNASIDHYWSPFLVESNCDHPVNHHFSTDAIVRVHQIERHAKHWTNADILIFNTYLWWRLPKFKILLGPFGNPNEIVKEVETQSTLEMALKTWSDWLEAHVNLSKTKMYFLSMSPTHERGEDWGKSKGENCYNETDPIMEEGYLHHYNHESSESEANNGGDSGGGNDSGVMETIESTINQMKKKGLEIQMLNITRLSEYRKDAHTSIYRKLWKRLSREELANPKSHADCMHWCIPGVPDVWNELLYAYIFHF